MIYPVLKQGYAGTEKQASAAVDQLKRKQPARVSVKRYELNYGWIALAGVLAVVPLQCLLIYCWGTFLGINQDGGLLNMVALPAQYRTTLSVIVIMILLISMVLAMMDMKKKKFNKINTWAIIIATVDIPLTQMFL